MNKEYRATEDWPYHISSGGVVYTINNNKLEVALLARKEKESKTYHLSKGTLH